MKYHFKHPLTRFFAHFIDSCIPLAKAKNVPIQRILVANGAHLGDVILSTSVLLELKKRYPLAHIGFLVGSWATCVIENHPLVDSIITIDHWKLDRSKKGNYLKTRKKALQELRTYDMAIDLYPYFPNSSCVLWQAKIPIRYGFTSGGLGALYTRRVNWRTEHILKAYQRLIQSGPLKPYLPHTKDKKDYLVFHKGAGDRRKLWDEKKWEALAHKYRDREIVYTEDLGLTWQQLVDTIAGASHVVTVDTCVGHIAAAVNTPCVTLHMGISDPKVWMQGRKTCTIPELI